MSNSYKPFAVVPLLVEQPTWGGTYIAHSKAIADTQVAATKYGQSYELAGETVVTDSFETPPAYITASSDLKQQSRHSTQQQETALQDLINSDPIGVLGKRVVEKYGNRMPLLIKFTQAQENSYQAHVTPAQAGTWQPKPESWYFFEDGKATLGLQQSDTQAYKTRCLEIEAEARRLSELVKNGELQVEVARQELDTYIAQDHPRKYVNTVTIPAQSVIDLSTGGIHHSWEQTDGEISQGNIVYEVQLDVKDDVSTLRSFDQGKMKDDGSVRNLTINEYFDALINDPTQNDPDQLVQRLSLPAGESSTTLFSTQHYKLTEVHFSGKYAGPTTTLVDSFHHLYAKKGTCTIVTSTSQLYIPQGWSGFIPAGVSSYELLSNEPAEVLITTIGD